MKSLQERLAALSPEQRDQLVAKLGMSAKPQPLAGGTSPVGAAEPQEPETALSPAQQRMWLFEKIEGSGSAYNIASVLRVRGILDVDALEWSINDVVRRHEILRTRFVEADGRARQEVAPELAISVTRSNLCAQPGARDPLLLEQAIAGQLAVEFCLAVGPLLRISVLELGSDDSVIVAVFHHIAADGWSLRLLEREISQAYSNCLNGVREPAPAGAVQYRDYVRWQRQWLQEGAKRQLDYWTTQLQGAPACWPMPCEQPRETTYDLAAASLILPLPEVLGARIRALAESEKASAFMVLAAAFKLVLAYFAGTRDISVGTPVANRREQRFDPVIGLFSNTVVLRSRISEGTFREFLRQTKATALGAFSNQDLPFEEVVEALRPDRSAAHPPLFQVLFALQSTESSELSLPGLEVEAIQMPRTASEFDLVFEFFLSDAANHAVLTYRTALFSSATIQQMQTCFLDVLERSLQEPDTAISALLAGLAAAPVTSDAQRLASAASLLATQCPLKSCDRVVLCGDLPEGMSAAARQWAAASGVSIAAASDILQPPPGAPPTVLVLSPDEFRTFNTHSGDRPPSLAACRLVLVHGDDPGIVAPIAEVAVWHCWSSEHSEGPYLVRRADGVMDAVGQRGTFACANALNEPLPRHAIGELTWALTPDSPARSIGLRGRLTDDGVRVDGFTDTHGWIGGRHVPLVEVEAALLRVPSVSSAAVVARMDARGVWRSTAYIVANQKMLPGALDTALREEIAAEWLPSGYVMLNQVPHARDGRVDLAALAQFAVLDETTRAAFAHSLGRGCDQLDVQWTDTPQPTGIAFTRLEAASSLVCISADVNDNEHVSVDDADGSSPMALCEGPSLCEPLTAFSLASMLVRAAREHGENGITYLGDASGDGPTQTYSELLEEATAVSAGLRALKMRAGERVLLQLSDSRLMLTGFWGCVLCGLVPVPVPVPASYDPNDKDLSKIVNAWPILSATLVLASSGDREGIAALARSLGEEALPFAFIEDLPVSSSGVLCHEPAPDDTALLLLTSGSTGAPKAVIQSHRALVSRSAAATQLVGFDSSTVSFNWMPLDHVGGLVMFHLWDVYLGSRQIQCPTAVILEQPVRWLEWMSRYRVSSTWAPNFAFALVNDRISEQPDACYDLSALRFVLNGGESVVPRTARTFLQLLAPHGLRGDAMFPAWGMSETCSGVTFNTGFSRATSADQDTFVEVGAALPGVEIRITDDADRVLPEGREGRLQIRGAMVTSGYLNNASATNEAFTTDGWFITGDLAVLRKGRLTITGREKDLIIVNGLNYYGHEIEQIVESVPDILKAHVAACGVRRPGDDTDRLAIFFSAHDRARGELDRIRNDIRKAVLARASIAASYLVVMEPDELPRTSIGKIQRPQLALAFGRGEFDSRLVARQETGLVEIPGWFYEPAWRQVARSQRLRGADNVLLICGDDASSQRLVRFMSSPGKQIITARFGRHFERLSENAYVVEAADSGHYTQLLEAMEALSENPWHIVHCGSCEAGRPLEVLRSQWESAHAKGLLSVLALARALSLAPGGKACSLDVVTHGAFVVLERETPSMENAGIQGLLRSFAQELPGVRCRQIDLDDASVDDAAALVSEITSRTTHDAVALRVGRRFVQTLQSCRPTEPMEDSFSGSGICLITGGLGGIGVVLAEWLLQHTGCHVLVLGRSDLLSDCAPDAGALEKRKAHDRLSRHGARYAYAPVDVCDAQGLAHLIAEREQHWSLSLRQVFHLAGSLRTQSIALEQGDAFLASMRGKALGAVALHEVLQARTEVEIIHFSSINGFFGGNGVSAYAAANSFLETLAAHRRSQGGLARCLSWSGWEGIGMSREYDAAQAMSARARKSLTAAKGFASLDATMGMGSLCVALACARGSLLIGLHGSNPNVARFVESPPRSNWHLQLEGEARASDLVGTDAFGARFTCRDGSGAVEQQAATETPNEMTQVEQQLATVWQDVLRTPVTGPDANFFELGGDSIMAIQVVSRASKAGVEIEARALFECQTLRELAASATEHEHDPEADLQVIGEVQLAPIQRWFFAQDFAQMHHMNQSVMLRVRRRLKMDDLRVAMEALLLHHDMLRARFEGTGPNATQSVVASAQLSLDVVELEYSGAAEYLQALRSHSDRLQASLDLANGPVVRSCYFVGHEVGDDRLLIVAHHLVVDGISWRIILDDIEHCLEQLQQAKAPHLGRKGSSYGRWGRAVAEEVQAPDAGALSHWQLACSQPTVLPDRDYQGENVRGSEASAEFHLDAKTTREIVQRLPSAHGVGVNDVLLAALYQAYWTWAGSPRLFLTLEGHGRGGAGSLDLSRTVGWFTAMYPVALEFDPASPLSSIMKQVHDHLALVPQEGRLYLAMRHASESLVRAGLESGHSPQISFNYLGRFDVDETRLLSFASEPPGQQISPEQMRFHELDIIGSVIDDEMRFSFVYSAARYRPASVQAFVDAFARALKQLATESAAMVRAPAWTAMAGLQKQLLKAGITGDRVNSVLPATPLQGGIIYESQVSEMGGAYVSHLINELVGTIDEMALRRAWQEVVNRHEIYRSGFFLGPDGSYQQVVLSEAELPWIEMDWSALAASAQEPRFSQLLIDDARRGFDLQRPPLLRIHLIKMADERSRMLISEHHCVSDGWSRGVLLSEVATLYRCHASGTSAQLPDAVPFARYTQWLQGFDQKIAQDYWNHYLGGMEPMPAYAWQSKGYVTPSHGEVRMGRHSLRIPAELTAALADTARRNRLTLGTLVQAAWGLVMAVQTGREDVNFLTVHAGRPATLAGVERIIGPLICTVPVRIDMARQASLLETARSLQSMQADRNEYGYLSLNDACSSLGKGHLRNVFGTLFAFENFPLTAPDAGEGDLQVAWVKSLDTSDMPLSVMVVPGEEIEAVFYYRTNLFEDEAVSRIASCFGAALAHAVAQPSGRLAPDAWMDLNEFAAISARLAAKSSSLAAEVHGQTRTTSTIHEF